MSTAQTKRRIAVIGGGVGAMSSVWALTNEDDWQAKYDITVYQMGWRLGGKGASGRGPNGRIQEHGLHIWLGFYENAFRTMRKVFAEIATEPGVYHSVDEAFEAHSLIGVMEKIEDAWRPWLVDFPPKPGEPGDGTPQEHQTIWGVMVAAFETLADWVDDALGIDQQALAATAPADAGGLLSHLPRGAEAEVRHLFEKALASTGKTTLHAAVEFSRLMPADPARHHKTHYDLLLGLLELFLRDLGRWLGASNSDVDLLRRIFLVADLAVATLRGLIDRDVMIDARGFDVLDDMEWQQFFEKYGAERQSWDITRSAPVRAFYDLVFAYENGNTSRPNFAAGAALRSVISIVLLYKKAVFMKMRAGMGDTIFAPFYKALTKRGVKFEFFHRLDRVELAGTGDARAVEALHFARQATPTDGAYRPLVPVQGLDCWPQAPLVDQLSEGAKLRQGPDGDGVDGWDGNWKGFDLENFWTTWPDAGPVTLTRGQDFDLVLFTPPPASHPFLCKDIIDTDPRWADMVGRVGTVRTQAMQLWLHSDLKGLGWTHGSAVLDAYQQPMNTWADMTHLKDRECWPAANAPDSIAYFCGPMVGGVPPANAIGVEGKAEGAVETDGNDWLSTATGTIWPTGSTGAGLNPTELVIDVCDTGTGLLRGQYRRANISPSERYVLSLVNSTEARIDADETGCTNLYVAGDWTRNGFNAGCVEAAVMSGLRAANAIAGRPLSEGIATYW